jgi:TRAP-type C4-dicarboxylate transport system permease large subunit
MASCSIGELFAAGFIPGLLMGLSLMIMVALYSHRRGYPQGRQLQRKPLVGNL